MGKKSKRQRANNNVNTNISNQQKHQSTIGGQNKQNNPKQPRTTTTSNNNKYDDESTHKRQEEESMDNLRFEDPFVDEIIKDENAVDDNSENDDDDDDEIEEDMNDADMNEDDDAPSSSSKMKTSSALSSNKDHPASMNIRDMGEAEDVEVIQSWHPLLGHQKDSAGNRVDIDLEMDPTAYKMYTTLSPEWPCLSFAFLTDHLGEARSRYPHSLQAVIGTQASTPSANQVTVLKLSDLSKLPHDTDEDDEEDILGEEYDKETGDDDEDSSDEDDNVDLDPILEHYSLSHYGGVNRIRVMPQNQNIVATWSDVGTVHLYDIEEIRNRFELSEGRGGGAGGTGTMHSSTSNSNPKNNNNGPFFSYEGHSTEGFAMDWSDVQEGALATGDNDGNIHVWTRNEDGSSYTVSPSYETPPHQNNHNTSTMISIEDVQWSPSEATVFAAAESHGHLAIYDTRAPHRAMLRPYLHPNTDVNVLSWNKIVSNLLATGGDDGTLCVWDLRHFGGGGNTGGETKSSTNTGSAAPTPLARFTCHQTPVTSVEWHPTDESMLAMSDEVGVYIYDLSVEEDLPSSQASKKDTTLTSEIQQLVADIPPQLLFCHSGSKQFKECHWHPQITSCVMTTAYSGFSVFVPSNL
mmetsp:Transcript_48161/g.54572  ORF Transcript_48161/g.54572 Transcript_48161/m.54572 type:complete len:634 (+) Transcript_48161:287-2188(+)